MPIDIKREVIEVESNQSYLLNLHEQLDNNIEELRFYAEEHAVPIVDKLTLDMIKQLIRIHHSKIFWKLELLLDIVRCNLLLFHQIFLLLLLNVMRI